MSTKKPDREGEGRAALATQRISLDDLEKLKQQSRVPGPLPNLDGLVALLGTDLDDPRVEDLGLREKRTDGRLYASSKALGIQMMATTGRTVSTIFLHGQGHESFHAWPGDLGGITFSSTPAQLKKLKGTPARSSTGWDRWDFAAYSLHVQYGGDGVQLITLMAPGTAP